MSRKCPQLWLPRAEQVAVNIINSKGRSRDHGHRSPVCLPWMFGPRCTKIAQLFSFFTHSRARTLGTSYPSRYNHGRILALVEKQNTLEYFNLKFWLFVHLVSLGPSSRQRPGTYTLSFGSRNPRRSVLQMRHKRLGKVKWSSKLRATWKYQNQDISPGAPSIHSTSH